MGLEKIYTLAKILYGLILDNFIYFCPIIIGFLGILISKCFRWVEKINIYMMFAFLFLGIYIGGTTLFYYSLPLSLFSVFGFLVLGKGIEWVRERFSKIKFNAYCFAATGALLLAVTMVLAWNQSMNTEYTKQEKEDFYLYQFREIVMQEENPTLLNISCLDAGLYTWADIMPNCRYFQSNMVRGFDEVKEEQLRYIQEGKTQFVLARDTYPEEIWKKYELVMEKTQKHFGNDLIYYLFKRK